MKVKDISFSFNQRHKAKIVCRKVKILMKHIFVTLYSVTQNTVCSAMEALPDVPWVPQLWVPAVRLCSASFTPTTVSMWSTVSPAIVTESAVANIYNRGQKGELIHPLHSQKVSGLGAEKSSKHGWCYSIKLCNQHLTNEFKLSCKWGITIHK